MCRDMEGGKTKLEEMAGTEGERASLIFSPCDPVNMHVHNVSNNIHTRYQIRRVISRP